ncbi:hypothetical protein [Amycolatopsis rifamycinica]|nr:hypothetical protein [Amycolatopsis rifamycinica]
MRVDELPQAGVGLRPAGAGGLDAVAPRREVGVQRIVEPLVRAGFDMAAVRKPATEPLVSAGVASVGGCWSRPMPASGKQVAA